MSMYPRNNIRRLEFLSLICVLAIIDSMSCYVNIAHIREKYIERLEFIREYSGTYYLRNTHVCVCESRIVR